MNFNKIRAGASLAAVAVAAVAVAAVVAAAPAAAQGRWEMLGQRWVGFQVDRDTIWARGQGSFSTIRICVQNNAVHFRDIVVQFANGERQRLAVNALVRPGQCARNLDLRGAARRINHVAITYNAVPNFRGRASVTVYGLHPAIGPGPGPWPGPGTGTWDRLGVRVVGFHVDRDEFVLSGEGRFRALRLCVARNAVHFRDVEVHFANGQRQDLPVRRLVGAGQCTTQLDLAGQWRRIRRVVMVYNAVPNYRGQAAVTLYGLR